MMKKLLSTSLLGAVLVACSQIPPQAYFERGNPENLLEVSSEAVNIRTDAASSLQDIERWIRKDLPTRAEINCMPEDALCSEAKLLLTQAGIPLDVTMDGEGVVTLVYERTLVRECENRYIDNPVNPYNLNHPTFGCSTAMNVAQMVTDKRQFTNPALSDYADADKAYHSVFFYRTPGQYSPARVDANFNPISATGASGGSSR